jgi:hypothetical protein
LGADLPVAGDRGTADLHEGQPDLRQRILEGGLSLSQSAGQALDQHRHGVDGQASLVQSGRLLRQMDGRQFEQAVGVIGYDNVGRSVEKLAAQLVEAAGHLGFFFGSEVFGRDLTGDIRRCAGVAPTRWWLKGVFGGSVVAGRPDAVLALRCPEAAHAW